MKKILAILICMAALCACTGENKPVTTPGPSTTAAPTSSDIKTEITPSDSSPITDAWTILGETMLPMGADLADVYLATDAERGADGQMEWDDSQEWAVVVKTEAETYVLLDSHLHGRVYMDVSTRGDIPVISVIHTSTVGLAVTQYIYENGAFYAEELIVPEGNGNNIYNSIPAYFE